MEGPCLQTVPASSPLSETTEEFVTFLHGKPGEGVFLSFPGVQAIWTGCSLDVLGYSAPKVTFLPRYLQWQR